MLGLIRTFTEPTVHALDTPNLNGQINLPFTTNKNLTRIAEMIPMANLVLDQAHQSPDHLPLPPPQYWDPPPPRSETKQ